MPIFVLVQNQEGRIAGTSFQGVNNTLTHDGILAGLKSKNVILNTLTFGQFVNTSENEQLFNLEPHGLDSDLRVIGVEADAADGARDGVHDFHSVDTNTANGIQFPTATTAEALEISYNGSNTGASGMVASGKSILIGQNIDGPVGESAAGYSAQTLPFEMDSVGLGFTNPLNLQTIGFGNGGQFEFFGNLYNQVYVNRNGTISFGSAFNDAENVDLSQAVANQNGPSMPIIAALWDEYQSIGGSLRYGVADRNFDGESDLVLQWNDFRYADDNTVFDPITFQVILFSDGKIRINYADIDSFPSFHPLNNSPDGDATVYVTGGVNATVGIWKGGANPTDSIAIPAGRFMPGPHSINGDSEGAGSGESNDSYVRMAWDTGGAAWDIGVVAEEGIASEPADALRDAFIDSLADQINDAAVLGKVTHANDAVMSIDFGSTTAAGSNGFTGDTTTPRLAPNPAPSIDQTSNSIPAVGTPAGMEGVFQDARLAEAQIVGGQIQVQNLDLSYSSLANGAYIVELFFAEISPSVNAAGQTIFDVLLEGQTVLNNYDIYADQGRIIEFDTGSGPSEFELDVAPIGSDSGSVMPAGVVKRFLVNVSDADGAAGLQITLDPERGQPWINGLRVLQADPPRVENIVMRSFFDWETGVEYSYSEQVAAGKQLAPVPLEGVDFIEIHFDGPVNIPNGSLTILGQGRQPIAEVQQNAVFSFDDRTIAIWNILPPLGSLPTGKYALQLNGVTGSGGQALDGDWANIAGANAMAPKTWDDFSDDQPGRTLLSGNGVAGGAFEFFFSVLPGDTDQDGRITASDPGQGDVDGDGDHDTDDEDFVNALLAIPGGAGRIARSLPESQARGDYNDNELVELDIPGDQEFGDYELWVMTFGNTPPADMRADGNLDGIVDTADYTVWRDHKGNVSAWYTGELPPPAGGGSGGEPVQIGVAPTVVDVTISGSESVHDPYHFEEHDGSGEQLRTVPVGGADTISITYSEDVNVVASDLNVIGLRTANQPTLAEFSYDLISMTATWRFENWAAADQYLISLSDAVTDVEGDLLDGEWTNPASLTTVNAAVSEFPSGDGTMGGDFNFVATLLPGDANLDLVVDSIDEDIMWQYYNGVDQVFIEGDFTGDGDIWWDDENVWMTNQGTNLQTLAVLADLNGDSVVDGLDGDILFNNWISGLQNPTPADGDLDADGDIDVEDLDLLFAQYGLELAVVS